ncbi:MAG TPA: hypothetical protein VFV35_02215 [Acidimicrobiales bacterium]|nr:hypothetical protein [Acidimicrobiales bacterium]
MSDLSNLLGDLYGDSQDPDGPSVRHEPAARDREEWATGGADDDLAEALSAALGDPTPAAPAPRMPDVPVLHAAPPPPAPTAAPASPAGTWTTAAAAIPSEPHAAPVMSAPEPVVATVASVAGPRLWSRGDDDILPVAGGVKSKKKGK